MNSGVLFFDTVIPAWLVGLVLTLVFAVWARWMRAVTSRGAIAGMAMSFLIYLGSGPGGFATLLAVFLLTSAVTQWRRDRKEQYGKAQRDGRDEYQIMANLFAAAAICAAAAYFPAATRALLPAAIAALCEAAADTVSSETGEAVSGRTRLITNFRIVSTGMDGGITLPGTIAGAISAMAIALIAAITGVVSVYWATIACVCGFSGMLFDSVLGATLERKGLLGNDGVNFSSTIFAANAALLVWLLH